MSLLLCSDGGMHEVDRWQEEAVPGSDCGGQPRCHSGEKQELRLKGWAELQAQAAERRWGQHPPSRDGINAEGAAEGGRKSRLTGKGVAGGRTVEG